MTVYGLQGHLLLYLLLNWIFECVFAKIYLRWIITVVLIAIISLVNLRIEFDIIQIRTLLSQIIDKFFGLFVSSFKW